MKTKLENTLIIVEGKSDIDYLSSFLDCEFYSVNGSAIKNEDIKFIRLSSKNKNVIVLTDPDYPGIQIRDKINKNCDGIYNAYIEKSFAIKNNKVGVAECDKNEVLRALNNIVLYKKEIGNQYDFDFLYKYNLVGKVDSKRLRKRVCGKLNIGYSNAKKLLFKLNALNMDKNQIVELINNVK